jgi:hypothetical protein
MTKARENWLVIKPDGNYLTSAPSKGEARKIANDYAKQYGKIGWRFVRDDLAHHTETPSLNIR